MGINSEPQSNCMLRVAAGERAIKVFDGLNAFEGRY